jgi:hypothetical protein
MIRKRSTTYRVIRYALGHLYTKCDTRAYQTANSPTISSTRSLIVTIPA